MGTTTKTLYDADFVEWAARTAGLLREGRLGEVDFEHVAEEIEDLGKGDRSAVRSNLLRMPMHLVKQRIQPGRDGSGWRASIVSGQQEIYVRLEDSPSLRPHLQENLEKIYRRAVRDALEETGLSPGVKALGIPKDCPYTLDELLHGDLNSLAGRW